MKPDDPMVDLDTIRRACAPVALWWDDFLRTKTADPNTLERALDPARSLPPLAGRLGAALSYILAGCPDLHYPMAHKAFSRVARVGRTPTANMAVLDQPPITTRNATEQLCLPGLPAATERAGRPRT